LKPYASWDAALQSPDVKSYVEGLRRMHPRHEAEHILERLLTGSSEDASARPRVAAPDSERASANLARNGPEGPQPRPPENPSPGVEKKRNPPPARPAPVAQPVRRVEPVAPPPETRPPPRAAIVQTQLPEPTQAPTWLVKSSLSGSSPSETDVGEQEMLRGG